MAEIFNRLGSGLGDRQVAPTTAADRPVEPARVYQELNGTAAQREIT
jgi:hypothetical protein